MAIATVICAGLGVVVGAVGLVFAIMNHSDLDKIKKANNIE